MKSNTYYVLEPEVPGGLGSRTQMDRSLHPPIVARLHLVFDGWSGDQMVECFPCFLVTKALAESLLKEGISGFELAHAEVETSDQFHELYGDRQLPEFTWLRIVGAEGDDFFLTSDHMLASSERAAGVILATSPMELTYSRLEER